MVRTRADTELYLGHNRREFFDGQFESPQGLIIQMAFAPEKSADVSPELIAQAVEAAFAKRDTMVKARFAEIEVSFSAVIARLERIELALHKKNKAPQTSKKKVAA